MKKIIHYFPQYVNRCIFSDVFHINKVCYGLPGSPLGPGGPMSPLSPFSPEDMKHNIMLMLPFLSIVHLTFIYFFTSKIQTWKVEICPSKNKDFSVPVIAQ